MLDLVIAGEALFLNDANQELSFRMATRGAMFMGSDRAKRLEIFEKLRAAYDTRSSIVHGSRTSAKSVVDSSRFMDEFMREAIKKALLLVEAGKPDVVTSWDKFAFIDV